MIASLFEMIVYIVVALLAVKMVYFRNSPKQDEKKESVSWKSAVESMAIMETRLTQLQERDLAQQSRIWALEDTNRDLQGRLARATKELLLLRPPVQNPSGFIDDSEDDDAASSIPTG